MAYITGSKQFGGGTESIDADYKRTGSRSFTIMVSIDPDAGETLETALSLAPNTGHPFVRCSEPALDGSCTLIEDTDFERLWLARRVPRQISRRLVEIDLEFDMRPPGTPPDQEESPNPVDWSAKWLGSSTEKLSRVMYKDADGNAVRMTNGELYATPVYEHINILVTRYRKYYYLVLPEGSPPGALTIDDYLLFWNNAINNNTYRTKPAQTWLLSVTASPTQINNFEVAELTFELRLNPIGWVEERLQHGSYYLEMEGSPPVQKQKPFRRDGAPTTGNLDAAGGKTTDFYYKKHRGSYAERNFNELGF